MIFRADIIFDQDDDEKERKVKLTTEEFVYMIRNCKDLNEVSEFINLLKIKKGENNGSN